MIGTTDLRNATDKRTAGGKLCGWLVGGGNKILWTKDLLGADMNILI